MSITNIDGDNIVAIGQQAVITMSDSANTATRVTLGGVEQIIDAGATDTVLPVTVGGDLPYGVHQLAVEIAG